MSARTTFSLDHNSPEGPKRAHRSKETNFIDKHGHLHHSYDPEKAPYPLSYDKEVIGLYEIMVRIRRQVLIPTQRDLLDHGFMQKVTNNVSFINWKDEPPTCVLDLGCGVGRYLLISSFHWVL